MSITLLPLANSALLHVKATGCFQVSHKVGLLWGRKGWLLVSYIHFRIPQRHFKTNQKYALWSGLSFINTTVKLLINCNYKAPGHTHTLLQTDLHYCASERVAVEGGQSSAEPATHYCTPLYSGWGSRKRGTFAFEWWHGVQEWEVSKHRWGCTYLGLLFLIETLRGRVPVALGGCLHRTVFVVVLQIRTERCLCERAEELDTASDLRDNISDSFFKIPKRKKELCGSLLPAWV